MDPAKQREITAKIMQSLSDQATVSGLLADLVEDYTIVTGELVQTKKTVTEAQAKIEGLQKSNLDLFLRIPVPGSNTEATGKKETEPDPDKIKIEDLFDPKTGKLKE